MIKKKFLMEESGFVGVCCLCIETISYVKVCVLMKMTLKSITETNFILILPLNNSSSSLWTTANSTQMQFNSLSPPLYNLMTE